MIKVFHAPQSRSSRLIWLLEELGADYEISYVNIRRQDGSGAADPANPHLQKQAPAIEHLGAVITESTVIFDYLCDALPGAGLKPADPAGRARFASWIGLYGSTLEPVIGAKCRGEMTDLQAAAYEEMCGRWKGTLEASPYLLGPAFSAIDILFGSLPMLFRQALPDDGIYDEWVARLAARPPGPCPRQRQGLAADLGGFCEPQDGLGLAHGRDRQSGQGAKRAGQRRGQGQGCAKSRLVRPAKGRKISARARA